MAAKAGLYTPLAFLLASFIALFTAISYAELSSRFPKSAGEAFYVYKAFHKPWLSGLIGWLVVFTGLVSAAAITRGFVGYVQLFIDVPAWVAIIGLIFLMGGIAIWGIKESVTMVMLITWIEVGGLLIIIFLAHDSILRLPSLWHEAPAMGNFEWTGIFSGAFLAFYAYIGFEDMVNVAEEIKNPEKNLPPAIFWALGIATLLYILVALAMILALPMETLTQSEAPLATFIAAKGFSPSLIGLVSLVAIVNGALAQVIMASRVMYGMAKQHNAPRFLATVHPHTQTPVMATLLVMMIILILALWFKIEALAKLTSTVILCVFMMIHLALIRIKYQKEKNEDAVTYSIFFPITGLVLSILFLLGQFLQL